MARLTYALWFALMAVACDSPRATQFVPTAPTPAATLPPPVPGRDTPILVDGTALTVGQAVESRVEPTDPVCFPNWDSGGQCRQFNLIAPRDGSLDVALKWAAISRAYDMTLFFVTPDGGWMPAPEAAGENRLNLRIVAGLTYRFIVVSYATPQDFELTTTLR